MLELAHWDGLQYFLVREVSPSRHIILVQDECGKKAMICLETGNLETGEIPTTLSFVNLAKAQKMIRDSRGDFLDYWNEKKTDSNP